MKPLVLLFAFVGSSSFVQCQDEAKIAFEFAKSKALAIQVKPLQAVKGSACVGQDLEQAKKQAFQERKPLLVWVGKCDESINSNIDNAIAVHVATYRDDKTERLILAVPKLDGMYERETFINPKPEEIKKSIDGKHESKKIDWTVRSDFVTFRQDCPTCRMSK